jgi:hypothetical protein
MSEGIGEKRGFEIVKNSKKRIITEKVSFLRKSGREEIDIRKYLVKRIR